MPKKKPSEKKPISSAAMGTSSSASVMSEISESSIEKWLELIAVENRRLQAKVAKSTRPAIKGGVSDAAVYESQKRVEAQPDESWWIESSLEEPLAGTGHQSNLFPWHPFPTDMDLMAVKKWTMLYSAVRSNAPSGKIADRFAAVMQYVVYTVRDTADALQVEHQRSKNGDREFWACVQATRCAMTAMGVFSERLIPAFDRGEFENAVLISLEVGFLLCKSMVLQSDHIAGAAIRSRMGREQGESTKTSNAEQRRAATQNAVREIWKRNPKQSLSTIQHALANQDGAPFGKLRTIQKNTVGMKYGK